jgi:heat shock protein HslJ
MRKIIILLFLPLLLTSCEEEKTVFIADHYSSNQTLLYRETKTEKWKTFSESIEGFTYEEGYEYRIKVKISDKQDTLSYKLIKIESRVKTNYLEEMKALNISLNKNWNVTKIIGFVNKTDVLPSFTIKNGRIEGSTGCNDFGGTVAVNTFGQFKTGRINSTKKYCKETMPIEDAFLPAIFKASKFKIENGVLSIMDKADTLLFTAEEAKNNSALYGKWMVKNIVGYTNNTGKIPSIHLKKGQIQGNNGCNNYEGTFITNNKYLFQTERIIATKIFCQEFNKLERAFMSALANAKTYKLNNNELSVYDNNEELLLTATRRIDRLDPPTQKTVVEYNTYSPTLALRNKLTENQLVYYNLRPTSTEPTKVILTKEELEFFDAEIAKLDLKALSKLKPPSEKFKKEEGIGATLIITKEGKLVRVPTFDHDNPPLVLRALIHKIMEIRNR